MTRNPSTSDDDRGTDEHALAERLRTIEARLERQDTVIAEQGRTIAEQRRHIADLKAERAERAPAPHGREVAPDYPVTAVVTDRRRLLKTGAAVAAAAVTGSMLVTEPAAAANGSPLLVGNTANTATIRTAHVVTGAGLVAYGLGVFDQSTSATPNAWGNPAVSGSAAGTAFNIGVRGAGAGDLTGVLGQSDSGVGVSGHGEGAGVFGTGSIGVAARGGAVGLQSEGECTITMFPLYSTSSHLWFERPRDLLGDPVDIPPPPTLARARNAGEVIFDQNEDLWLCVVGGTPGTWRKVSGLSAAGSMHVLNAPARVYDSRPNTAPSVGSKTKLAAGVTRVLDTTVNASGVPAGAVAAVITILLVNAVNTSANLTIWADGAPKPAGNTMVWGGGAGRFCTTGLTRLSSSGKCQVQASASTDLVLDVVGYYL